MRPALSPRTQHWTETRAKSLSGKALQPDQDVKLRGGKEGNELPFSPRELIPPTIDSSAMMAPRPLIEHKVIVARPWLQHYHDPGELEHHCHWQRKELKEFLQHCAALRIIVQGRSSHTNSVRAV